MLTNRAFWASQRLPLLAPEGETGGSTNSDGGSGAATATETTECKDDIDQIDGLGDKGKEAIRKEREAAKAAADRAKAAEKRLAELEREKSEREAADLKAKEDEAAKKGEFETLAKKREEERDEAKREATSLKAENDQLRAAIAAVLDAEWKALPDEVRDAYLGAEDDPLAKLAFLPKGKTLAAKLSEKAEHARGNGRDPKAGGTSERANDETARAANALRYR